MKKIKQVILPLLLTILGFYFLQYFGKKGWEYTKDSYEIIEPPPLSQLAPELIDLMTLGFKELYNDFQNIWMLQILANEKIGPEDANKIYEIIYNTIRHDIKMESYYLFSCVVLQSKLKAPHYCEPIIVRGLKLFPHSWRLNMMQGFVSYYIMGDTARASIYYMNAAKNTFAPPYVRRVAEKLALEAESVEFDSPDFLQFIEEIPGGDQLKKQIAEFRERKIKEQKELEEKGEVKEKTPEDILKEERLRKKKEEIRNSYR